MPAEAPMGSYTYTRLLSGSVSKNLRELFNRLAAFFASQSLPAHLVGGSVRDLLMGRETHDLDIAIKGDSFRIGEALGTQLGATLVPLGQAHGVVRLVLHSQGSQSRLVGIDLSSHEGSIQDDLARRDFTVDAMAIPIEPRARGGLALLDPFGGKHDLELGIIRVVKASVFKDDPARLMRAVRLAAQLEFALEPATRDLVKENAPLLSAVAPERVREEFLKTLSESNISINLHLLDELGLLCAVIPELSAAKGVEQPKEHYWNVFYHCIEAAGAVERVLQLPQHREKDPALSLVPWHPSLEGYFQQEVGDGQTRATMLKLAGLLHDIAKPETKTFESNGRMRFFGHATRGAAVSSEILKRLKVSGRNIAMVETMVEHHLRPGQMSQQGELPTQKAVYRYFKDLGDAAIATLYLNLADYLAARGPNIELQDWACHCKVIGHILHTGLERGSLLTMPKLVDGYDIMQVFGLAPGPLIGELLSMVEESQGSGEITTKEEALALVRASIQSGEAHA